MINTTNFDPFSATDSINFPNDLLVYAHLALDSYAGTGRFALSAENQAPYNWTLIADDSRLAPAPEAEFFEATAYQNDLTDDVVIAFRGTDNERELIDTSIPLGAAVSEDGELARGLVAAVNAPPSEGDRIDRVYTDSYLLAAWQFYDLVPRRNQTPMRTLHVRTTTRAAR